jgi:hypothetical protein
MVPVERPKTNEKFASSEQIRKWKTGLRDTSLKFFSFCVSARSRAATLCYTESFMSVVKLRELPNGAR